MGLPWCGCTLTKLGISTIDDTAKQLTQLASTDPNWPYALVWLNGGCLPCAPPYRGSPKCYDRGEYKQRPLQKDPPNGGLPTSGLRFTWVVYPEGLTMGVKFQ